ncbi:MAG TPA: LptF/LptG family permease [Terrimicrobiaceae bacterium]|jgi:lipopolysaccharide export system permease protein|nr:LptF/LptG family permease [Terrimicrobiaceae bacterium]
MRIFDRYVLQKFALPFVYCFLGFIAIWFIFDLSDNLPDFLQGKAGFDFLLEYYKSQIPEIIVISLPIGALLALLYSLTSMSRSNEIISMLGAGVSVVRLLVPLVGVGLVLTAVTAYFNYESAPHAAMIKKRMIRDIKRGKTTEVGLSGHLYRNREDLRTWFSRKVYAESQRLLDVQIVQQDADGNIVKQWYARDAVYNDLTKTWNLQRARYVEVDADGRISKSELHDEIEIEGWRETPWRIASSVMNPDYLSVPELEDYLVFNKDFPEVRLAPYRTQLHYRWALPWVCLLVVFIAAPLGIVYSRRGILGGVAAAIGLFFSLVFFSSLFVALGKGNRISPGLATWGPIAVYFLLGFALLWLRSTNREFPKIKLPWMS